MKDSPEASVTPRALTQEIAYRDEVEMGEKIVSQNGANEKQEHEEHPESVQVLYFVCGGFAMGCVLQLVQERYMKRVPYTCLLFVAGFGLAIYHYYRPDVKEAHEPLWYRSIDMWMNIEPHLIFYIFLPALIFAEAMRVDINLGRKLISQVAILACPGVLLGTFLTAAFGKLVLPYGWSWQTSLVFGSILAATDPVAVVALFNTLGVSPKLTMLVSGESIMNDGTAIVCFGMMMRLWEGTAVDPATILSYSFEMTVLAVPVGLACGALALWAIFASADSMYHSDTMIQSAVTVCCAFLSFFLAETYFGTSGVLSVMTSGLMIAFLGWPRFVSKECISVVWEFIEFLGNTLIFLLAGLLFGHCVFSRKESISLGWTDVGWLFAVYGAVMVIRGALFIFFWPILNCVGNRLTWQEGFVMTWSGLRGAVGLTLAILADRSMARVSEHETMEGSQIMFLVGGVAMLTIIINATLAGPLLRCLGFTDSTEIEKETLAHIAAEADANVFSHLDELLSRSQDIRFKGANLELVQELVPTLSSREDEDDDIHVKPSLGLLPTEDITTQEFHDSKLKAYREMFVHVVQHKYWQDIEGGIIPRCARVARNLLSSAEAALDNVHIRLSDWERLEESLLEQKHVPFLACLSSCWPLSEVALLHELCPSRHRSVLWEAYTALSYVEAHRAARDELRVHFKPGSILGEDVQASVLQESEEQCRFATDFLLRMPPKEVQVARSHMLAGRLLVVQTERINHLREGGILNEKGATKLLGHLQDARRDVARTAIGFTLPMLIATNRQSVSSSYS